MIACFLGGSNFRPPHGSRRPPDHGTLLCVTKAQASSKRATDKSKATGGLHELSWQEFDRLSRKLAEEIRPFHPELVIGIAKGGIFLGGALAGLLGLDFQPVRLVERSRDRRGPGQTPLRQDMPPEVKGRRILLVDDVSQSGNTLKLGKKQAEQAGAKAVRTSTLLLRLGGGRRLGPRPNYFAIESEDLVVFPWDYELSYQGPGQPTEDGDPETFGA
jgi:hypoxanthine phosphoribosyltransferase